MNATYEILYDGRELRLIGDWSKASFRGVPWEDVEWLSLNAGHGWNSKRGIAFLAKLPALKGLKIVTFRSLDLGPLNELKSLELLHLRVPNVAQTFDLSSLGVLRTLQIESYKKMSGVNQLKNLRKLVLRELPGIKRLDLSGLSELSHLTVADSRSLRSLDLSGICSLSHLTLAYLPNLNTLDNFEAGSSVRRLDIGGLNRIDPKVWKQFVALEVVESTTKQVTQETDFGIQPRYFIRFPL